MQTMVCNCWENLTPFSILQLLLSRWDVHQRSITSLIKPPVTQDMSDLSKKWAPSVRTFSVDSLGSSELETLLSSPSSRNTRYIDGYEESIIISIEALEAFWDHLQPPRPNCQDTVARNNLVSPCFRQITRFTTRRGKPLSPAPSAVFAKKNNFPDSS